MSRYTVAPSAIADMDEIGCTLAGEANVEVAQRLIDSMNWAQYGRTAKARALMLFSKPFHWQI